MSDFPPAVFACDMHCHTVRSDGRDTPQELIANAASLGMHAVGIADHDIDPPRTIVLDDGRTVDTVAWAKEQGVTLVLGDEFSTDTYVDDVHIVGYGLDWDHPDLKAEVVAAKNSKSQAYEALCNRLTEMGMPVDWEADVLTYKNDAGEVLKRDPDEVQRKHIFEALAARGHAPSWSAAKLMVRDNPDLNIPRRKIDPIEAIKLIHRAGGIAVLAHPYLIDEVVHPKDLPEMTRAEYIDRLFAAGLDAMEARYTYDKTTFKGTMTPEEVEAEVRAKYADKVKFFSGGSDYHADYRAGAKKVRSLGERGLSVDEFEAAFGFLVKAK